VSSKMRALLNLFLWCASSPLWGHLGQQRVKLKNTKHKHNH